MGRDRGSCLWWLKPPSQGAKLSGRCRSGQSGRQDRGQGEEGSGSELAIYEVETTSSGWKSLREAQGGGEPASPSTGSVGLVRLRHVPRGERTLDSHLLSWGPSRSERAEAGQCGARTSILGKVSLTTVAG